MSVAVSHAFQDELAAVRSAGNILDTKSLRVAGRREEIITEPQPLPITTADLIAEAAWLWHWSGTQTMSLTQWLFERGLITYPRTDSTRISPAAAVDLRAAVMDLFGFESLAPIGEHFPPQTALTHSIETCSEHRFAYGRRACLERSRTDAHEAIRPTDPARSPDALDLPPDQSSLYQLIWQRSLASQMKPARLRRIIVTFENLPGHVP